MEPPSIPKIRIKTSGMKEMPGVECRSCGYGVGLLNADAAPDRFAIECTVCGAKAVYSRSDIETLTVVRKQ